MTQPAYIELRAHSAYSLLRGTSPPEALVAEAAHLRLPGLALTDHNNVYGAVSFQKAAQALDLQPILGAELTIEPPPPNPPSPGPFPHKEGRGAFEPSPPASVPHKEGRGAFEPSPPASVPHKEGRGAFEPSPPASVPHKEGRGAFEPSPPASVPHGGGG